MAKMITVTQVGGVYLGPENDTPRVINSDDIKSLTRPGPNQLGSTKITFKDDKFLFVTETEEELRNRINGTPLKQSWLSRLFGEK